MNICRNIWFSLASAAIISACIFLFCVFYSIITNVQYMVVTAESTMGITVFFDESLPEDEIHAMEIVDNASNENNENTRRKATVVPIKIEYV